MSVGKKKTSLSTMIIYLCIVLVILYCAAAVGLAFDRSKDENGKIDFKGELLDNIEGAFLDYNGIFENIGDNESYCRKLTFLSATFVGIYALLKYTSKKRLHRKGEEHGSARWATEAEAKKLADKSKVKKGEIDNNILLTQEVRMSLNTRQHRENLNVLVIGGSGSGKSRFYVKPNLMQLNTSYVVTDPKGELLRSTGKLLKDNGYEIKVFNLIDMRNSHNYNPFAYVYDRKTGELNKSYVIKMVNVLMKNTKQEGSGGGDQFWDDSTKTLLSALAFYLLEKGAENEKNFSWVMQLLKQAEVKEDENGNALPSPLDLKFEELEAENPTSMAVSYYKDFKKAAGETAKSILISCAVRLQAFNLPDVANLTHTDTLELDKIGDKKTAVFVIIPSSDVTFNFLAAMMYTQLFDTLYDTANFKYGGRLPVHVRCLLDEFANIGTIPDFDKLLATMRSMEISANIIIQNIAQLKKMYDKSWEILTGNCDSLLFLGGKEASTTEMISKALGKETIDVVSQNRSKGRNSSTSINNSIMGRELMTADELTILPTDECILIVRAFHPFHCHKFDIEKHPNYKYLEDSDKNNAYLIDEVRTLEMPSVVYNPDDHTEKADDSSETDKKIMEILEQAQMKEESEMLSDEDIPDTAFELNTEFGEAEEETADSPEYTEADSTQTDDVQEDDEAEPAEIMFSDTVSEMKDEPFTGESFEYVDMSRPLSFEADDKVLNDDNDIFI